MSDFYAGGSCEKLLILFPVRLKLGGCGMQACPSVATAVVVRYDATPDRLLEQSQTIGRPPQIKTEDRRRSCVETHTREP
eukprot:5395172-Amphidinium_carterae.1